MFEGKTLVGLGCSHTFGSYGERFISESDSDAVICHERSWVKKLEKIGNFKSSVNLASPGGSNDRSFRVLMDFLSKNNTDDLVVVFSITELARMELPTILPDLTYEISKAGPWLVNDDEFLNEYYLRHYSDDFENKIIIQKILMLSSHLTSLNIEHYFFEMLTVNALRSIKEKIKTIEFYIDDIRYNNAIDYVKAKKFVPDATNHFDHDANQCIAEYLYKKIRSKKIKLSQRLLESPGFCVMPFFHSCIFPGGQARPCCINFGDDYGNINNHSIDQIFSSKNTKLTNFRKKFLNNDTLPDSCNMCKTQYSNQESYRHFMNSMLASELENYTSEEELLYNEKYYSFDVRLSSLCNLRCHYCGPQESSRVAEEWAKLNQWPKEKILLKNNNVNEFFNFFERNINNLRKVYSCGGEPILLKEHYVLLDLMLEHNVQDNVEVVYNSNLTHLTLGEKNILDYWKKFPNVLINVSIDAGWEQFEYIRDGGQWEDIYNNLKKIVEIVPHVKLNLSPVITFWNMFHFPKLYKFLVDENLIKKNSLILQPVNGIDWMHPSILPAEIKEQIVKLYKEEYSEYTELNHMLNTMMQCDSTHLLPTTKLKLQSIDKLRDKDFYKTFPEYKDLFKGIL